MDPSKKTGPPAPRLQPRRLIETRFPLPPSFAGRHSRSTMHAGFQQLTPCTVQRLPWGGRAVTSGSQGRGDRLQPRPTAALTGGSSRPCLRRLSAARYVGVALRIPRRGRRQLAESVRASRGKRTALTDCPAKGRGGGGRPGPRQA